jgi:hypothetical protein
VPAFAWRNVGKLQKISVRIFGVPAEIRTRHLQNTGQNLYHRTDDLPVVS